MAVHEELSNFIWAIADLLRGPYRPPQYERVMLPLTVLRRFDCVLEATKADVIAKYEHYKDRFDGDALDSALNKVAGQRFHNRSPLTFEKLKGDPDNIDKHLQSYIDGFSRNIRDIFRYFEFTSEIEKMQESNILYLVVSRFCDVDLHPARVDNPHMGLLFEDLIRRFNEQANETAGDHFTPREVIDLMVALLFQPDDKLLSSPGAARTMLDPTCGTGGMLAVAQKYLFEHNARAELYVSGQDFNPRAFAMAASDLLMKSSPEETSRSRVEFGDSLLEDKFKDQTFDYFLANPPFGVDWKRQQKEITREHEKDGHAGRFGAGLPRVNDGSLLFLQHMLAKFEPVEVHDKKLGSRLAIVFSGSPLFTGGAGSGESNIRKWIIENDWLEAIIALPEQMFYNTGIGTYIWVVTNRKAKERVGKIQLIDARARWKPMRRSMGDKRRQLGPDDIAAVVREYGASVGSPTSKIFRNPEFGYTRVTVERPLRLRFQITDERKSRFLEACPHQLDVVQYTDAALGREPHRDWNAVWRHVEAITKDEVGGRWTAGEQKLFRTVFTDRDPLAAPVIAKREKLKPGETVSAADNRAGWFPAPPSAPLAIPWKGSLFPLPHEGYRVRFEADADRRDFENVPLTDDVDAYFLREVLPHVPDAWMERDKDKVGYEINFNRHFHQYTPPRALAAIDADLKRTEETILKLLQEVTE